MESRKIYASFGILGLVVLHAALMRIPTPSAVQQPQAPTQSFSFDTLQNTINSTVPVNAVKRDEIKRDFESPREQSHGLAAPATKRPASTKPYLDLFVGSDPGSQQLLQWFNTDTNLNALKAAVNYQVYAPGDALYKARYQNWVPPSQFPAIVFEATDGGHIYIASQESLPTSAPALFEAMKRGHESHKKASEQLKLNNPVQSSSINSNPNCPDGSCRPFFPPRFDEPGDDGGGGLFNRPPASSDLVQAFLRANGIDYQTIGILAVAVLALAIVYFSRR